MNESASTDAPVVRRRRSPAWWLRRTAVFVVSGLLLVLTTGAAYQVIGTALDRRNLVPPGRLVDIGGRRLHVICQGEEAFPTVILEAGAGSLSTEWAWVQPELARTTRVCAYDRAGLGWSESADGPRDGRAVAADLHTLLDVAKIPGPYVLVGHSYGGLLVRAYALYHPEDVAGLVLIEPSHPDQLERLPPAAVDKVRRFVSRMAVAPLLARFGVIRILKPFTGTYARGLPAAGLAAANAFYASPRHLAATHAELAAFDAIAAQAGESAEVGDRPLLVLSASIVDPTMGSAWHEMHADLATLSSLGSHRIIEGADHLTIVTTREYALTTAAAIRTLIETVRRERPAARAGGWDPWSAIAPDATSESME